MKNEDKLHSMVVVIVEVAIVFLEELLENHYQTRDLRILNSQILV